MPARAPLPPSAAARYLPDFDGRLNGRQVELLCQYLTVPYLRIPLVLKLLSDESRVRALSSAELQGVLDSVRASRRNRGSASSTAL